MVEGRREIPLDVGDLGRSDLRKWVWETVRGLGYTPAEEAFWGRFGARRPAEPRAGTLVVGDLSRIAKRFSADKPQRWTARIRRTKPYFVAFLRTRRDERCAWLVDDLLRDSDLRFRVCRARGHGDFRRCVAEAVLALEPDSIVAVRVPPGKDRLHVEFADGLAGEVAWDRLGVDAETSQGLILESASVEARGKAVDLLTREGELFDIDAAVIRAQLDPEAAAVIGEMARRSEVSVGERVRAARQAAGLTQTALAERIGMDQAVISRLERGRHRPRFDTLVRVANGLDLSVGELLAARH